MKYRHLFGEALGLDDADLALLAVLMLRGPQTPGELKTRTERLHAFESMEELGATLERLIERELVASLGKRPGQREERDLFVMFELGEGHRGDTIRTSPAIKQRKIAPSLPRPREV